MRWPMILRMVFTLQKILSLAKEINMESKTPTKQPYLWPVGRGGMVDPDRVVAVGLWSSAPIRRAARNAKNQNRLIDLTYGQLTRWVLFLDSGHLVLASKAMPVTVVDDSVYDNYDEVPPWD
jgi:regulator of extracellular matrix RemA (YlzA/DUF370 family)